MVNLITKNWQIENIDTILFDKDGTFVDSDFYWGKLGELRINTIIKHFRLNESLFHKLCHVIGYDVKNNKLFYGGALATLSRDEVIEILVSELKLYVNTDFEEIETIFELVHKEFLKDMNKYTRLIDGAKEFFENLHAKNVKMAVVTSDAYTNTVETLKYLNIEKYFDVVIGHDSCSQPKKTGLPALVALNKLNSEPLNTIVVGDAPMDAQMGKNANLKATILTTTGQVKKEELLTYSPYIIDNLKNIEVK